MNQKGFVNIFLIILAVVIIGSVAGYFEFLQKPKSTPTSTIPPTNVQNGSVANDILPNPDTRLKTFSCKNFLQLSEANRKLVEESKAEIIKAGISAPYFDQHFCLLVIEVISPRTRILWKYTINNYEMIFEDDWSKNTHYILQNIQPLHDVVKTVPKKEAKQLIESCTGPNFGSYLIAYQPLGDLGSRLHIVASSKGIPVTGEGIELVKNTQVDLESGKVYCGESKVSAGPR